MGFIDQKDRPARRACLARPSEKAGQLCLRVEGIVIIADDHIREITRVQSQLIRTHPICPGIFRDHFGSHGLTFGSRLQQIPEGGVHAVIMTLRPAACCRIAIHGLAGADALPGCQDKASYAESLLFQYIQCLYRRASGDCLGGQIEDSLRLSLTDRFQRRKKHRHGLPGSRGSLEKKLFPVDYGPIDPRRQIILALPVGEGESHFFQGPGPALLKRGPHTQPGKERCGQLFQPGLEIRIIPGLIEILHLSGHLTAVGHADPDAVQFFLLREDPRVAAGLGQMDLRSLPEFPESTKNCLDLVDHPQIPGIPDSPGSLSNPGMHGIPGIPSVRSIPDIPGVLSAPGMHGVPSAPNMHGVPGIPEGKIRIVAGGTIDSVRASLQTENIVFPPPAPGYCFLQVPAADQNLPVQGDLRPVPGSLLFLKRAMNSGSFEHGSLGGQSPPGFQRSASKQELYKAPDRYTKNPDFF